MKESNKESVFLFSLPVAPISVPVVSSSKAEEQSLRKMIFLYATIFFIFTILTFFITVYARLYSHIVASKELLSVNVNAFLTSLSN